MPQNGLAIAIVLALAVMGPAMAAARTQDPALLDLSLDELLKIDVSAASFNASSLRDATASITVLERQELERLGFRHLHEVLNWVPGAYTSRVAATGLENRTVLRGNPGTAGGGLLAIDGQRVNTMQSVRAWGVVRDFPLSMVERVEIIRGPGGARFGGGPSDEVVNVVTRRGDGLVGASVSADGGHSALLMTGATHGDWRLDLRATQEAHEMPEYTGLFDRYGRITRSTESAADRTAILDLTRGRHGLQVLHHESDIEGYYGLNGSINPGDESQLEATWWRYSGEVDLGDWRLSGFASALRQRYALSAVVAREGTGPFGPQDFRQRGVLTHRNQSGGFTLQRRFDAHTLTFGGETQSSRTTQADLQANYTLGPLFLPLAGFESTGLRFVADGARDRMTAAFIEDDWRVAPEHRLVIGARYDDYEQSGSALSPRAAWVWTPGERYTMKLLVQEAFFAPTLGQLFLQNNPVIAGSPELEPTSVRTTELIGRYQSGDWLLSGTYYHRDAKDGFVVVPLSGITATTVNAGRQHTEGVEAVVLWTPAPTWRLRLAGSTIFEDRYVLPASIAEAPPGQFVSHDTASMVVNWMPTSQWEASFGAHWRSREGFQAEANDPRAMLQVNFRPSEALRLWLHVDNLFDARGVDIDVAGGLGIDPRTGRIARDLPLPGREWQLGMEWAWR
ncbi:TonB-dependent receptor [Silanimonas sp.]|uniref:TonB-dependent receptor plug domain-containing protein n=1 Tax=Silanimonas sp. TaxID=1929290 RepID=UPI0022C2C76E|nr:TonB-dependent receptor [Silanimonas sp.]MCZ8114978.1 TonB-dependent receptor [Silanimonas sp.]